MNQFSMIHTFVFVLSFLLPLTATAEEKEGSKKPIEAKKVFAKELQGTTALNPESTLFLNLKEKSVFFLGTVCLQEGLLEMLCCPTQTKEHESIVSSPVRGQAIHTALLSVGAETGSPVKFDPEFQPPTGEVLEIIMHWKTKEGMAKQQSAKEWIRTTTRRYFVAPLTALPAGVKFPEDSNLMYDTMQNELLHFGVMTKKMKQAADALSNDPAYRAAIKTIHTESQPRKLEADWVFTGSQLRTDPSTGETIYLADGGDLICVANFPSAMIDVAVKSAADDALRGYEANPEEVPPMGTAVLIELRLQKAGKSK